MSAQSPRPGGRRLDAQEREVVYCHNCTFEWYRDEGGLICPECHSEITEIVSLDNDPRAPVDHNSSASTSPEHRPINYRGDSDPDEVDLEEQLGLDGFLFRQNTRAGPDRTHHNPGLDPVMERFAEMIRRMGPPQSSTPAHDDAPDPYSYLGVPADSPPFHHHHHHHHYHDHTPRQRQRRGEYISQARSGARASITTATIGSGSFTIYSGPLSGLPQAQGRTGEPFDRLFADMMREQGPPNLGEDGQQQAAPHGLARSLQDILGLLSPANAMAGDAVYSQEALDRIITNLMETNPQSNAAPPATDDALEKLDRRKVTKDDLAGEPKTECSICIDDLNEGDLAAHLPCKHWFHDACVVAWLREHNTCPICRTPIEKTSRNARRTGHHDTPDQSGNPGSSSSGGPPLGGPPFAGSPFGENAYTSFSGANLRGRSGSNGTGGTGSPVQAGGPTDHEQILSSIFRFDEVAGPQFTPFQRQADPVGTPGPFGTRTRRPERLWRSQSQYNSSGAEAAVRNVNAALRRQRERSRADDGVTSSSSTAFDSPMIRLARRNSLSPTSPRQTGPGEQGARMRQRSPPQSSHRESRADREAQRQHGNGPISWLRDRFTGGWSNQNNNNNNGNSNDGSHGSNNSGSSQEERRY